eukprot:CAMPEP_0177719800 /NCGR_PEP_ID=MMETSP0484_2-20121128/16299_1 /TAXON_ID=354590 /ORGANISM="Rhodomonas lens, Strain RHODO" /LENGTH=116 /DNA_ID=CAMNT_0019232047 /DNA_START=178 /DNA_END=528 /DNA_ORIENTATION=+
MLASRRPVLLLFQRSSSSLAKASPSFLQNPPPSNLAHISNSLEEVHNELRLASPLSLALLRPFSLSLPRQRSLQPVKRSPALSLKEHNAQQKARKPKNEPRVDLAYKYVPRVYDLE